MNKDDPIGERMATVEAIVKNHDSWIRDVSTTVKNHDAILNQAKGGWILLCLMCGGSAGVGALIIKFWK